jgi:hypothetical protein
MYAAIPIHIISDVTLGWPPGFWAIFLLNVNMLREPKLVLQFNISYPNQQALVAPTYLKKYEIKTSKSAIQMLMRAIIFVSY